MSRFEVEIKFRDADHDALARRLGALGAEGGSAIAQEDLYFAHPSRDFRDTDEALRLRRSGSENRVTYKGPKLGGPAKTREEIEVAFDPDPGARERLERLWRSLGFRAVASVRKTRTPFRLDAGGRPLEVGLDLVEGLGTFAEVEALADGPDDLAAAQRAVLDVAARLGLAEERIERRSYLRMILERAGSAGPAPGDAFAGPDC